MNKLIKLVWILAFAAVIGLSIFACVTEGNGMGNGNGNGYGNGNGNGNGNGGGVIINIDPYPPAFMTPQAFNDITAVQFVAGMKIGWNLGNTLDAYGDDKGFHWLGGGVYANTTVSQMEAAWVGRAVTSANIQALKNAGFDTIRIPVTWFKALDSDNKIREDWMKRVTEIVNYAVALDMYIIINTHHDEEIFKFMNNNTEASLVIFKKVWEQIASQFKNYNEKLIFEGLNEPRTKGSTAEWGGGTAAERTNLNRHYQVFVDTVRNTGGNNDKRFLMITTYAASANQNAIDGLVLPKDSINNKLIVSIHFYEPYRFALSTEATGPSVPVSTWDKNNSADTTPITSRIDRAQNVFVSKGIPVIIGEFGAMNRDNEAIRAEWAEFYVSYARSKGIPCVWWDNSAVTGDGELFGLLNRSNNTFHYPLVMDGLMKGAGIR